MVERAGMQPLTGHSAYGTPVSPRAAHPVWRNALIFGALNGLFALLQALFSSYVAIVNYPAFASLSYGIQNGGFQPNTILRWLAPVAVAAYGSCLLGFVASLWLCWHAGRAAAVAAGRRTVGPGTGLLTSVIGSAVWIIASIILVLLLHTDATITGMLATTPDLTTANLGNELVGLAAQEIVAALLALGFGALAGRSGANHARLAASATLASARPPRMAPPPVPWPPGSYAGIPGPYASPYASPYAQPLAYPPAGAYPPAPWGYPPASAYPPPMLVYPPPPELYRPPATPPATVPGEAPPGSAPSSGAPGDPESGAPVPEDAPPPAADNNAS